MSYRNLLMLAALLPLMACSHAAGTKTGGESESAASPEDPRTRVLELAALGDLDLLIDRLAGRRVIFVGEQHDRYEDHLNQLAIVRGLQARGKPLAIGLEFFQQPWQSHLDDYVAGRIDEAEMLARTGYFERWSYDYRLYRPILRFAREQRIPLIALNLEAELTRRVGEVGIAGLTPAERTRIPAELDRGDAAYRERLEAVFKMHPADKRRNIEHFIEVQLVWDEGMAARAARALREHPERTLVVLAGAGHLEYGQGIPRRLLRRIQVPAAIVLNGDRRVPDPALADFLLYPQAVELPPAGRLGVRLDQAASGPAKAGAASADSAAGTRVTGFADNSAAPAAGLREGDRLARIGNRRIENYSDVRIALIDARPGERVPVEVLRPRKRGGEERLRFEVELR